MDRGVGGDSRSTVEKRSGYLSWDDYFMSVAFLSAMRSKDPSTQVGAVIGAWWSGGFGLNFKLRFARAVKVIHHFSTHRDCRRAPG